MASQLNETTTADEAATLFSSEIKGKTVLITGCSPNSIGAELAYALAQHDPALLVIAGRNTTKLAEVESNIKVKSPKANVRQLQIDLASLDSVRKASQEVLKYSEPIDVLYDNAGIMANPYEKTVDGYESQLAVNHLGPFLFTQTILPLILKAKHPRIVMTASDAHYYGQVNFDDLMFSDGKTYDKWKAYFASKSANVLYATALAQRYKDQGLLAFSLQPGVINSGLLRYLDADAKQIFVGMGMMNEKGEAISGGQEEWKTLPQGASTCVVAGFRPDLDQHNGAWLKNCQVGVGKTAPAPHAVDPDNAKRLWEVSEKLVGI